MSHLAEPFTADDGRADQHARAAARARDCIRFAVVTSEGVAAELIDRAVEIRKSVQLKSETA